MRSSLYATLIWLAGCSSGSQAIYQNQGECQPPTGAQAVTARTFTVPCALGGPSLLGSQAELDGRFGACVDRNRTTLGEAIPTIDFQANQVIAVPGDDSGRPTTTSFVVDDGAHLYLGLTHVQAGIPYPNLLIVIPRTDHPLQLSRCDQVCVGNCDQAIP